MLCVAHAAGVLAAAIVSRLALLSSNLIGLFLLKLQRSRACGAGERRAQMFAYRRLYDKA
jgi:hypothetical protein